MLDHVCFETITWSSILINGHIKNLKVNLRVLRDCVITQSMLSEAAMLQN